MNKIKKRKIVFSIYCTDTHCDNIKCPYFDNGACWLNSKDNESTGLYFDINAHAYGRTKECLSGEVAYERMKKKTNETKVVPQGNFIADQPNKKAPKLVRNRAKCRKCGDIIESKSVHDFQWCKCQSIFTDGGLDYIRRGGDPNDIIDMSECED